MDESTRKDEKAGPTWIPEIDQLLIVGLKNGRAGTQEAIKKVKALMPELTPGEIWARLRYLRERQDRLDTSVPYKPEEWPAHLVEILKEGYLYGGDKKREALKTFRIQFPGISRHVITRFVQKQGWTNKTNRPQHWTSDEEEDLFSLTGDHSTAVIAKRMEGRTPKAVRVHLNEQGYSTKRQGGLSGRKFQDLFRIGYYKFYSWIGSRLLTVADPRITAESIKSVYMNQPERFAKANCSKVTAVRTPVTWNATAKLLGCTVDEVLRMVSKAKLKVVDTFVPDKALREFCQRCNKVSRGVLNVGLIRNEDRAWLAREYKLHFQQEGNVPLPRTKHALTARTCKHCKKQFYGNVYFSHIRDCKAIN